MRCMLLAVCWWAAASAAGPVYYQTSFDVDDSAYWAATGGTWTVDTAAGTVSKSSNAETTFIRYRGPIVNGDGDAIHPEMLADYTVAATIARSGAGGYEGSDAAVIGRAKWLSGAVYQYYMLRYNDQTRSAPARQLQLHRVNAAGTVLLHTLDADSGELSCFDPDRLYILSLTMTGTTITGVLCQEDKSWSITVVDAGTNVRTGTGGLRIWQGTITCHDFAMTHAASEDTPPADPTNPTVPAAPDPDAVTVLIEAEAFENKGGWVVDQQFMDQMGSPFLLAHGMTGPVADAMTTVTVPRTGTYRAWVRTRDWTGWWKEPYCTPASLKYSAGPGPGRFEVLLNGRTLTPAATFGSIGADWHWQDGGTVPVDTPTITLTLRDLTGHEGRCDAVVLTTDMTWTPPNADPVMRLWRRSLLGTSQPVEAGHYDLVVVGGGMAGCCAAVSGARHGLSVALIQDRPVLGGNNSSEVRVGAGGRTNFAPYPKIGDIVNELVSGVGNRGAASGYLAADRRKRDVVLSEPNVDLYLNYRVNEVQADGNTITTVIAEGTTTDPNIGMTGLASVAGRRLRFTAGWFADCTGDGAVGYLAGADWDMTISDGRVHRMGESNLWRFVIGGQGVLVGPYLWALDLYNETSRSARFPTNSLGDWFWESGFFHDPFADGEYIRDWNLLAAYGAWDALKNRLGWTGHYPEWQAYVSGKRETRRLLGDVVLDDDDFFNWVPYPDGCVPTSWGRDLHFPHPTWTKGFEGDAFISSYTSPGYRVPYWIPYRCLYSRNIDNLFMAGRDISVTHEGLGPVRVMRTCGMMGEIVGMAASLCKKHGVNPRAVYTDHLAELQVLMLDAEPRTHTNVALGKPVVVDSLYNASYVGANAVDGDNRSTASRWLSAESPYPHWIEVDLQGEYAISQVRFWTGYTSYETPPSDFHFQRWDGHGWVDIFHETGNTDPSYGRDFPPVSTTRVRLYATAGPIDILKLFEIEVGVKTDTASIVPSDLPAVAQD